VVLSHHVLALHFGSLVDEIFMAAIQMRKGRNCLAVVAPCAWGKVCHTEGCSLIPQTSPDYSEV